MPNALKKTPQPRAPRRRAQGRPEDGKAAVGPELLIRAARELLKELPAAKVTRAAVARRAKVDPNLIRYYFRNRDSLLKAVLDQIISERMQTLHRLEPGSPNERLQALIRSSFEWNATYPFFHRLLVDEVRTWKSARARQTLYKLNQSAIHAYAEVLKDGAKDHSLRRVDPALLHIAVIGMCEFFGSSRFLLEDAFGKNSRPDEFAARYSDLIVGLVAGALTTR